MKSDSPALRRLRRWLIVAEWRAHPAQALVALGAIALGVALGFAVHSINAAAFNEFTAAAKSLSGQSDLQVRGVYKLMDEAIYPRLAKHDGVALASPVLEVDGTIPGKSEALHILGTDVFRASIVSPDLTGQPAEGKSSDTLADDAVFLSPAAMDWLQVHHGDILQLRTDTHLVDLRVAGGIAHARAGQRIGVMDIAAAQWRFNRLGKLSHVDLKLADGIDREAFKAALARELGTSYLVSENTDQEARTANMSRAYRVNLNMLAMVALFTGAFLVLSTQALSVLRRRSQIALLRVMGMTRQQVLSQILLEGALLGVMGSLIGLALGHAAATAMLTLFGSDLGGGYFPGVQPRAHFSWPAAAIFFLLGTATALLGCASPAMEAAGTVPAHALKSGSEEHALSKLATPWPGVFCLMAGIGLSLLPPVSGLPVFGYVAIGLLLVGAIALMPRLAALLFRQLSRIEKNDSAVMRLALARLANAPNQASIALGGVLTSFSLMVAMAIMVSSFRISVDEWLAQLLPADLYVRSAASNALLSPEEQRRIVATPGVLRGEFQRYESLALDAARPPVTLIARNIDVAAPDKVLPIVSSVATSASEMPIWASEAMVDLYDYVPGKRVELPIGGKLHRFVIAGIWRDYARQSGALQMRLDDYRAVSGDTAVNDVALCLQADTSPAQVIDAIRHLPFGAALTLSEPGEIRRNSLRIFDRSFAVTYLLEAVAIVIGLFGVAVTVSAQTLARVKEFGMLRHVGVTRGQITRLLASEGGLLTLLGMTVGFILGAGISLILVFVVNPQSFHWTMRLHVPWVGLGTIALVMLAAAAITSVLAGRHAVSGQAVHAVREDW